LQDIETICSDACWKECNDETGEETDDGQGTRGAGRSRKSETTFSAKSRCNRSPWSALPLEQTEAWKCGKQQEFAGDHAPVNHRDRAPRFSPVPLAPLGERKVRMLGLFISSAGALSICDADFEDVPELARPEGEQARYELTATCAISLDDEAQLCGVYEEIVASRLEKAIRRELTNLQT
jgi:hypothetical protein